MLLALVIAITVRVPLKQKSERCLATLDAEPATVVVPEALLIQARRLESFGRHPAENVVFGQIGLLAKRRLNQPRLPMSESPLKSVNLGPVEADHHLRVSGVVKSLKPPAQELTLQDCGTGVDPAVSKEPLIGEDLMGIAPLSNPSQLRRPGTRGSGKLQEVMPATIHFLERGDRRGPLDQVLWNGTSK
ncbi:MAG TPA: hypothetical protein VFU11_05020 [Solirubrobacterales bacterium]|nr:hypothetical protein [Solirubrobacterales bacterium]